MPSIGWQELIIVLVIILVIFGPKRLPEIGRSLGKGIREFKKSTNEIQEQLTKEEPQATVQKADQTEDIKALKDKIAQLEGEAKATPKPQSSEPKTS